MHQSPLPHSTLRTHWTSSDPVGSDLLALPGSCDDNGVVTPSSKTSVLDLTSSYFPPELLNRLDSILVFNKLSRSSILKVVSLRLKDVADRLHSRRITLDVDQPARELLAKQGYSEVYGARAIARVVRTDVLFPLAQKLLKGTIRCVFSLVHALSVDRSCCMYVGMEIGL